MNNKLTLQQVADILLCKDIRTINSYIEKGLIPEIAIDKENCTIDTQILAQKMGVLDFKEPFISEVEAKEILGIDHKSPISSFCKKHGINMYRLSSSGGSRFLFRKSDLQDKNKMELTALPIALQNIIMDENFQQIVLFLDKIKKTNLVYYSEREAAIFFLHLKGKSTKEIAEEISTPDYPVSSSWVLSRLNRFTRKMKSKLSYFCVLMDTFEDTEYFGMEPVKILENFKNLKKENEEMREYVDSLKKRGLLIEEEQEIVKTPEEIKREELLSTHIKDLDLSVRLYNTLKDAEYYTLGDIVDLTPEDVLRIRNSGKKNLQELINFLESMGLKLKNS